MNTANNLSNPILQVDSVSIQYGNRMVLNAINLVVQPSEICVILGPSGCGKTTLLKAIIGLLTPSKGTIRLFGKELVDLDSPESMALLHKTGILFQNGALLGSLTVEENVALPLEMHSGYPPSLIREIVQLKLSQVGLSHATKLLPQELSGGMKKRAALARALALDPQLLFCDEPSAGLDPVTAAGLDDLLLSLRQQLSIGVVVVTHELESIKKIADTIVFLYQGSVLYNGPLKNALDIKEGPMADFFKRVSRFSGTQATSSASLFTIKQAP
jgi:phospholipid/cholesterol/gamma-HCH transport system ATP-binding protein